jgi:hypothetical protein
MYNSSKTKCTEKETSCHLKCFTNAVVATDDERRRRARQIGDEKRDHRLRMLTFPLLWCMLSLLGLENNVDRGMELTLERANAA